MRQLSNQAIELLGKLEGKPGLLARITSRDDPRVGVATLLGLTGEAAVVPHLAPYIFASEKLAEAAMEAIRELLSNLTGEQLLELDAELRCNYSSWRWDEWRKVKPSHVRRLDTAPKVAASVFGVLCFHPSGHVREEAVRRLAEIGDGSEVPFLLIRLNDWVPQIRAVSHQAVLDRFQTDKFAAFFEHLDLVFRLIECGRDDHFSVVQIVSKRLASPDSAKFAADALCSPSRFVRRHSYTSAISASSNDRARFVHLALLSEDSVLRLWATRDAKTILSDETLRKYLPALIVDRFMPVRREALNCVMQRFPTSAKDSLIKALFDANHAIRDFARYHLRRLNGFDVAAHYRQGLNEAQTLAVAIEGLGETGRPEDALLLTPLLRSIRPKIRASAVRSLGTLGDTQHTDSLVDALTDDDKKVILEACKALKRRLDQLELSKLLAILRSGDRRHVKLATIDLIAAKEFWSAMPVLVEAAASPDDEVALAGQQKILQRVNRIFTSPNAEQRTSIINALEKHADRLPPKFLPEIRQWLDSRR